MLQGRGHFKLMVYKESQMYKCSEIPEYASEPVRQIQLCVTTLAANSVVSDSTLLSQIAHDLYWISK